MLIQLEFPEANGDSLVLDNLPYIDDTTWKDMVEKREHAVSDRLGRPSKALHPLPFPDNLFVDAYRVCSGDEPLTFIVEREWAAKNAPKGVFRGATVVPVDVNMALLLPTRILGKRLQLTILPVHLI